MRRLATSYLRLLPVTIFAAALLLSVRVEDLWKSTAVESKALALAVSESRAADSASGQKISDRTPPSGQGEALATDDVAAPAPPAGDAWTSPLVDLSSMTASEIAALQELASRRATLETREREMEMREGLLKAAERRVEEKIDELKSLQQTVRDLMIAHEGEEAERVQSLVTIYEKMKPKNAAEIFNDLDMAILLDVFERMKESKSAPILAAMDPKKAQKVTTFLANRGKMAAELDPTSMGAGAAGTDPMANGL